MGAAVDAETASRGREEAGRRVLTSVGSRSTRTRARPGYRRGERRPAGVHSAPAAFLAIPTPYPLEDGAEGILGL